MGRLRENCEPLHLSNVSVSSPLFHGKSSERSKRTISIAAHLHREAFMG